MTADFSDDPNIAEALIHIGDAYRNQNKHNDAISIYQCVLDKWSNSEKAIWSLAGLIVCNTCLKNNTAADAAFERLGVNYSNHPQFYQALNFIGDNLRWRNINSEKARQMYELATKGISANESIWPKLGLAITSIRLSDYKTAEAITKKILADFDGDEHFPIAACLIADEYRSKRRHKQAIELYQYVIDKHVDSEYAMWSQMGIAISNIDLHNNDAAQAAIEKLCANYKDHPSFYKAVCDIADNYRWREIHDKAHEMYKIGIVGISSDAIWPKAGLAITSVHIGNYQTAKQLTGQIQAEFAEHEQLPEVICLIAGAYRSIGDYKKALNLYQHILKVWPRSEQSLWSKAGMARIDIARGDEAAAKKAIDKMIVDFAKNPILPQVIFSIGEEYWNQALSERKKGVSDKSEHHFKKTLEVWEKIITELPPSQYTIDAWYFSGVCYRRYLGDYEKALACYQKVVNEWPDYRYAWSAQAMIARCYEQLVDSGRMSKSEAQPKIEQAYKAVIDKYPDCSLAPRAYLKLGRLNLQKGQLAQATEYFELFIEKYPQAKQWRRVLFHLGLTYERMGKSDAALELYRTYIEITNPAEPRLKAIKARIERLEGIEK